MHVGNRFLHRDVEGCQGGVEFGFMSCTTQRNVALEYGCGGYLLSIRTGLVARGACLAWLSYYPEEMEVCFPPLTALDVLQKQSMDKGAVVVELAVVSSCKQDRQTTCHVWHDTIDVEPRHGHD